MAALRDIHSHLGPAQSLAPAAYTSDTDGSGVDLRGFDSAMVLIDVGAYTDGTHTFEVQESDDDSNYTAVADADLQGTEPVVDGAGAATQTYKIGYTGDSRYVRVVVTATGTSSGAVYGGSVIRSHAHQTPVS